MCGRYTLENDPRFASRELGWTDDLVVEDPNDPAFTPRYNIAPTQWSPVILQLKEQPAQIRWMRWGLVPSWAKDTDRAARLINARIETAFEKPSFRDAWLSRRCVVLVDGYYEWRRVGKSAKEPYLFRLKDGEPMAFAGLWERWSAPKERDNAEGIKELLTFTVLTTSPNSLAATVHDRMPVILDRQTATKWLAESVSYSAKHASSAQNWMSPYPAEKMEAIAVSSKVNRAQAEGRELIAPVDVNEMIGVERTSSGLKTPSAGQMELDF